MSQPSFLQLTFQKQIDVHSTSFEKKICAFLFNENQALESRVDDEYSWQENVLSEDQSIENWKNLLTLNFFYHLKQSSCTSLAKKIRFFEQQSWNQSSQYFRSIVALNHALAKMPIPDVGPHLLMSGAALIDLHEYSPWLALPYTPQHYEFGIFLSILCLLTGKVELKENILRLAKWQLNTLDAHGIPFEGLFVRERDGQTLQYLYLSYLLFKAACIFCKESSYHAISQAALNALRGRKELFSEKIHPLWVLIEKWLENFAIESHHSLFLSEHIHDPSTALVGFRSSTQHVMCTLHGAKTGLGTLRFKDVEIVSYGPQYFPLADCEGFGIEGNALSDHGVRRSMIEWKRQSFILKGCARMVDEPGNFSSNSFEFGTYRGIWLEVVQEFKRPHFYVKTDFLGLDGWDCVAFSFFVKARQCSIIGHKTFMPRTLESYEGESSALTLEGSQTLLEINPIGFTGTMQVIPLSGARNFWGADFLVSYHLSSKQPHYEWHIGPVAGK